MPTVEPTGLDRAFFYYDLGSPACYLASEQVVHALPVLVEWQPVLARDLGMPARATDRPRIERLARSLGLQDIRWPESLPPDSWLAMLAATYAKQIGRAVSFSLAAFRQAFAAGRDLGAEDTVLIAGAACEIHPTALLKALERPSLTEALLKATDRAREDGVTELPAIGLGDRVFMGEAALEEAAQAFQTSAPTSRDPA